MPNRKFTVTELEEMEISYCNEYKESRGSSRWSELFDIVFRADDGKLYHVVYEEGLTEYQDYSGAEHYPHADHFEQSVVCAEVELYETMRPVILFRRVEE